MGTRGTENELRENPAVKTEWRIGQRTPAWTKLWLRIFADVLPNNEDATKDAAQGPDEPSDVNPTEYKGVCDGSGGS